MNKLESKNTKGNQTMKVNINDLVGAQLDYAVAEVLGYKIRTDYPKGIAVFGPYFNRWMPFMPSRDWKDGGPIIERISGFELKSWLESKPSSKYEAHIHNYDGDSISFGPTALIAAMRVYVQSQLCTVNIDIPEELR